MGKETGRRKKAEGSRKMQIKTAGSDKIDSKKGTKPGQMWGGQ